MRFVVALGGNALLRRGQPADAGTQLENLASAVPVLAELAREHEIVITHGNGPQVGLLALESEADTALSTPYPLDALGAETQGMIGYWLARELGGALPGRECVAILTQTVVDPLDAGFADPTKFIGPAYSAGQARRLGVDRGWQLRRDGAVWRRVVPSPQPQDIVELSVLTRLVDQGVVVIAAGGGGVPVVRRTDGTLRGVEAVVDKDLTAARLAVSLHADVLLMLTDVDAVYDHYGTPDARPVRWATPETLRGRRFPAGSMAPKVEAACRFVTATPGGRAAIGALSAAGELAAGTTGTQLIGEAERPASVRRRALLATPARRDA